MMLLSDRDCSLHLISFADEFGRLLRKVETAAADKGVGLAEARILRLLSCRGLPSSKLANELNLDSGQVARAVKVLSAKELIVRQTPKQGPRGAPWFLTPSGRNVAAKIASRQVDAAREILLSRDKHVPERLLASMRHLNQHFDELADLSPEIREAGPGETGTLVAHAVKSFTKSWYGYDSSLTAHLHRVFAEVLEAEHVVLVADRQRELCGGLALVIERSNRTAKIPFLAMFNWWQGHGWGAQLLGEAVDRAQKAGLDKLLLEMPDSRLGPSYLHKFPAWDLVQSVPRRFCGQSVQWESWSRTVPKRLSR